MKALSIASLFALGIAGSACSQAADAVADEPETPAETAEPAADVGGSFNLGLPSDVQTSGANSDGFNLALPNAPAASTDGFNLATDVSASTGLANVAPEIPVLPTDILEETEPEEAPEVSEDDEPIIRLD